MNRISCYLYIKLFKILILLYLGGKTYKPPVRALLITPSYATGLDDFSNTRTKLMLKNLCTISCGLTVIKLVEYEFHSNTLSNQAIRSSNFSTQILWFFSKNDQSKHIPDIICYSGSSQGIQVHIPYLCSIFPEPLAQGI